VHQFEIARDALDFERADARVITRRLGTMWSEKDRLRLGSRAID